MAITYYNDIEQGTDKWKDLRELHLTGTDAKTLIKGIAVEEILKSKKNSRSFTGNSATRRGHRLEPEAIAILEAIKDVTVHHTGFITNDKYPIVGYSPDGLIGDDALVECKAFAKDRHLENSKHIEVPIMAQIQWGLFVSERAWAYLVLYNPDLPPEKAIFIIKVERNEILMKRFESLIIER
jgi:hypothetical protein